MSIARLSRLLGFSLAFSGLMAGCAAVPATPPPPPGLPGGEAGSGPVLGDWRSIVTRGDRDRYVRRDAAWSLALQQARRQPGSGNLGLLGNLVDPDAALARPTPPPGSYRCRTVKLGSQGGDTGLGYVIYGWFACRIEQTPNGLKFSKITGSQRPSGLMFPEDDRHMIMLGSTALGDEPASNSYGRTPDRDVIAVVERIGDRRWRLVIPWPQYESNLDLIELVPG